MLRDSLGNVYKGIPKPPPVHHAKSTNKFRKFGRSNRKGEWRKKVKAREAQHRAWGHRFPTYPC